MARISKRIAETRREIGYFRVVSRLSARSALIPLIERCFIPRGRGKFGEIHARGRVFRGRKAANPSASLSRKLLFIEWQSLPAAGVAPAARYRS